MRATCLALLLFSASHARSQSFVYAPSITLPAQPMVAGETEIRGGVTTLAETRPQWAAGITTAGGNSQSVMPLGIA
ncbi:MAG: hypothetical protein ABIR47_14445 [Candidatus Kapaibacterium sp.]